MYWCCCDSKGEKQSLDIVKLAEESPSRPQSLLQLVTSTPVKQGTVCEPASPDLVTSASELRHLALIYSMLIKGKSSYWLYMS